MEIPNPLLTHCLIASILWKSKLSFMSILLAQTWKQVVDSVHLAGAKIFMQLQHTGSLSQGNRFAKETIAPSAIQPKGEQLKFYLGEGTFQTPRLHQLKDWGLPINNLR